ncbi:hypothetical protein BDV95DRAFT_4482 [Massariosphaeria phaeospora]|uniref:Uncharacterized protein n=1 Tax=Massariosphaeria phaeospora TaxID=100035 RepID=A0A7C8MJI8_9PLEO|nr:hypothetical protein BDV95DRAFT_4482 [Massariosphaeria phaeospora]
MQCRPPSFSRRGGVTTVSRELFGALHITDPSAKHQSTLSPCQPPFQDRSSRQQHRSYDHPHMSKTPLMQGTQPPGETKRRTAAGPKRANVAQKYNSGTLIEYRSDRLRVSREKKRNRPRHKGRGEHEECNPSLPPFCDALANARIN